MKKWIVLLLVTVGLLGGLWLLGGLSSPAGATYKVTENPDGTGRLSLVVERPGIFMDVILPDGAESPDSRLFAPWPGNRRRALTFWRGPLELTLAEGAGPFAIQDLPVPVRGGQPSLSLPSGWLQVAQYVGKLQMVQTSPVQVAAGPDVADTAKAAEQATALFTQAGHMFGVEPRFAPQVIAYANPAETARNVVELWLQGVNDDAAGWWERGAVDYYTMRLMDKAELWSQEERGQYMQAHSQDQDFLLVVWLDMSMQYESKERRSLANVVPQAITAASNDDVLDAIEAVSGLGLRDRVERMLAGKEPLPRIQAQ